MHKNFENDDKVKQNAEKKERHENNKIPDFEDFFKSDGKGKGLDLGKGFMRRLLKQDRRPVLWSSFLYLFQNAPVWALPLITSDVIDLITDRPENLAMRLLIDAVICVVLLVQNVPVTMLRLKILNETIRSRSAQMKQAVMRKLQKLSITYHREIEEGAIQSKILRDMENAENYYKTIVTHFTQLLIGTIVSAVIAVCKSPIAAAFFVVIIPTYVIVSRAFSSHLKKYSGEVRRDNERLSAKLTTSLQMMTLTKSHGLADVEGESVNQKIDAVTRSGLKLDKTNASFGSVSWVVSQSFSLLCLAFCVVLALNGVMSVGEVILFQSLFSTISASVLTLIAVYPSFVTGNEALGSIAEIMRSDDVEKDENRIKMNDLKGDVEFENVCYRYPDSDKLVVDDFSLKVKKGETIAIVGASGSGKSSVMNLLVGLLSPTSGDIRVDGVSLSEVSMSSYRKFISVVPQNSILFSGTIRENITYGLNSYSEERFNQTIEDANITEFLDQLPNGVDSQVGERGDKLSGGQKQRVSIARALIRDPKILILDEATSALDNVSEYCVQKAIDKLIDERTTFVVAHRLSTIRNADRIVVMEEGKIVESGSYESLMEKKGKFYDLERKSRIREEEVAALG